MKDLYQEEFVEALFNEMSKTYTRMNLITSFGFSQRWRRQCIEAAGLKPGMKVADLMTGMGEAWKPILKRIGKKGLLVALDLSKGMLQYAERQKDKYPGQEIGILRENVLANSLPSGEFDCVISSFGLKTFSLQQTEKLATEIWRTLKPGGSFSLIEISDPKTPVLRHLYKFYLKLIIPFLGRVFLGNPENYRMLGVYTERFGNCREAAKIFTAQGFEINYTDYFMGCASGFSGRKPEPDPNTRIAGSFF